MFYIHVHCVVCGKAYTKDRGHYNEAINKKWKFYCSDTCHSKGKNTQLKLTCGNTGCNKTFFRQHNQVYKVSNHFCSHSCAAIVNNPKSPKRIAKIRTCPSCNKNFTGGRIYCSFHCISRQLVSKEQILEGIISFQHRYQRIPLKREFRHYKAARNRFGTWNNAVKAAGFKPNPVRFANRHIARDGHACDSLAEKIIDDWLSARNIPHERSVPYGMHNMTADFKIGETFVEFLGLVGELPRYDQLLSIKRNLWKKLNIKIITLTPSDLFPRNQLARVFATIIDRHTLKQQSLIL